MNRTPKRLDAFNLLPDLAATIAIVGGGLLIRLAIHLGRGGAK